MSLSDKILNLYEKYGALSSERVTFLLEKDYKLRRNIRTIQREISKLVKGKKLISLPLKGREQTYELFRKQPSALSSVFLSRIWDEIFAIRKELHCPEKQFDKNWENFFRLRSLVQLLPEDFKRNIKPKIDNFCHSGMVLSRNLIIISKRFLLTIRRNDIYRPFLVFEFYIELTLNTFV